MLASSEENAQLKTEIGQLVEKIRVLELSCAELAETARKNEANMQAFNALMRDLQKKEEHIEYLEGRLHFLTSHGGWYGPDKEPSDCAPHT